MTENSIENFDVVVIGGGAAGYFAGIHGTEDRKEKPLKVLILEGSPRVLTKVKVSGGGRCNVTHSCFEPRELVKNYPRGFRELLGVFHRFQPSDTVQWFHERDVSLKTEKDGRMFPTSNRSQTIIDTLEEQAHQAGVEVRCKAIVKKIEHNTDGFSIHIKNNPVIKCSTVIMSTGGSPLGHKLVESLGHSLSPMAPSLFTFKVEDSDLLELSGISVPEAWVELTFPDGKKFSQSGPLLVTHWGLSGPAILKLSAFAALEFKKHNYKASLSINWSPRESFNEDRDNKPFLAKRLWRYLESKACIDLKNNSKQKNQDLLSKVIHSQNVQIVGKGVFKEEFVTCGGVESKEVDFRTMSSKLIPGLFFAGEILNVDGITGGFNFQNAWSTGYLAGISSAKFCKS